jgi:hypothetical protein
MLVSVCRDVSLGLLLILCLLLLHRLMLFIHLPVGYLYINYILEFTPSFFNSPFVTLFYLLPVLIEILLLTCYLVLVNNFIPELNLLDYLSIYSTPSLTKLITTTSTFIFDLQYYYRCLNQPESNQESFSFMRDTLVSDYRNSLLVNLQYLIFHTAISISGRFILWILKQEL